MKSCKTFNDFGIKVGLGDIGRKYKLCPQCSHTRSDKNKSKPCLSIYIQNQYPDVGYWKCHNCGWTGGIKSDFDIPTAYTKPVYSKPTSEETISGLPKAVIDYFQSRGIPEEVLVQFGISYEQNHFFPDAGKNLPAILFPYIVNGEVVDIKYRGKFEGSKRFTRVGGAELVPYNIDSVKAEEVIVWCEGEIDVMSVGYAGFNAISPPLGAPQPNDKTVDGKFKFWEPFSDFFLSVNKHIIAVDNDGPGRRLADELIKRLGAERCYIADFPEDCKDANDVLKNHGVEYLRNVISDASPLPVSGLTSAFELGDKVFDLYEYGASPGEPPGWASVEELYTVERKQLTVVTGVPGHGKSTWLNALTMNLARNSGWNFVVFSPEMQPVQRHIGMLAAQYSGKPFLKKYSDRMTRMELAEALCFLEEHYTFIDLQDISPTLSNILEKVRVIATRKTIDGFILDPWNEVEHNRPAGLTETEYISECLRIIGNFARTYNIHIWVVAHPRIIQSEKDLNGNIIIPVPTLYMIAGSANWNNKPHNGIVIWRDRLSRDNITQVHVQKVRFDEIGRIGMAELKFDPRCGRYYDINTYNTYRTIINSADDKGGDL